MQNLRLTVPGLSSTRRGNVLAFLLMGIIALIAIAIVLFSRARREHHVAEPASAVHTATTSTLSATGERTTAPAAESTPHIIPPPPPSLSTPTAQNLPPEG